MTFIDRARQGAILALLVMAAGGTAEGAENCVCSCFDGRPMLICPVPPPEGAPVCVAGICPPKAAPFVPPPLPEIKACTSALVYNAKTKQFETRRICK